MANVSRRSFSAAGGDDRLDFQPKVLCGYMFMCYCYVRMSERDVTALNRQLLVVSAVRSQSRDEVERLLDLGAEVDACGDYVCY